MRRFLNMGQPSERLGGLSRSSIYNDIREGRLPAPIKIGQRNCWGEHDLEEFIRAKATEGA